VVEVISQTIMALHPLHAAILGLVEGITEYLPVSSTGHLIIASALLVPSQDAEMKRNIAAFEIVIQGGAILAVLGLYWPRVVQMLRGVLGKDQVGLQLARNIIIAFLPAAILGVLLKDVIERHLFYPGAVMAALLAGGVVMILIGRWQRKFFHAAHDDAQMRVDAHAFTDIEHLTWRRALLIGLLQCVAMWPGTSRSMVTIVGGMLVGMKPRHAAEFSFLLGLPTLGGACIYSAYKNLTHDGPTMIDTLGVSAIVIGVVVATISAAIAVKWLVSFLTRHGLAVFGWYRIALCAVLGGLIWRGVITIAPDVEHSGSINETGSAGAAR
jgi:undecaprenyl-diphosphatase